MSKKRDLGERLPTSMLSRDKISVSPLRQGYYTRNPLLYHYLKTRDALLRICGADSRGNDIRIPDGAPKRILFANGAHLGDIVIATSVLPVVKSAFPEAKIGFLVGSWARPVIENHPLVDSIHIVDHWRLNRTPISTPAKLIRYLKTRAAALEQIKRVGYGAAVELRDSYPNSIDLMWQAGIPIRIGYASGGLAPLLTRSKQLREPSTPAVELHLDLLRALPVTEDDIGKARLCLARADEAARRSIADAIQAHGRARPSGYIVVHPGTGASFREWPLEKWHQLTAMLLRDDHLLVFTGHGRAERERVERIIKQSAGCVNLCGRLGWSGLVAAIEGARLLVGVESVAAHIAAAVDTPSVAIFSGIDPNHWRPWSRSANIVTAPVPCAPCHSQCQGMECVRWVEPEEVHRAVIRSLDSARDRRGLSGAASRE